MNITGKTQLTCLLGSPVSHSISPLMHNEAFKLLNLDYAYLCFDVNTDTLKDAVNSLKLLNARGFNCTMPVKNLMCELSDELSTAAKLIGAVNTVVIDNNKLIGHNTDGVGYMQSVKDAGYDIINKKMTLLGAGGAASAICVQAALDGVNSIDLYSIKDEFWQRAQSMTDNINNTTDCKVNLFELPDDTSLKSSIDSSDILVNGTSLGMEPHTDRCVINDINMFHEGLIVSDVIYNPRETKFLSLAKKANCNTFNGMYMLLYQGAKAFELWTKKQMPVDVIKEKFFN